MPQDTSQIEPTLADLGINLISTRIPELMNHYLGFEMITSNEERTRAAGLLGFQAGQEFLYVPVLFLNGRIKGTETLYLKNSDVFTSNSKQWVSYLTSHSPGIMGSGARPQMPLQQPSPQQLGIFSRVPQGGKLASDGIIPIAPAAPPALTGDQILAAATPAPSGATSPLAPQAPEPLPPTAFQSGIPLRPLLKGAALEARAEFFKGAADEFWNKVGEFTPELMDMAPSRPEYNLPTVLKSLGKTAYLQFVDFVTNRHPWILEKLGHFYDLDDLLIEEWPDEPVRKVAADSSPEPKVRIVTIQELVSSLEKTGADEDDKKKHNGLKNTAIAAAGVATGAVASRALSDKGLRSSVGDAIFGDSYRKFISTVGHGVAHQMKEDFTRKLKWKGAFIESLTPEQKEECMTEGLLVIDKRAADEKTLTCKEDYITRFDAPRTSGFYEIVNRAGALEKVFVAVKPFLIEDPHSILPGSIILDLDSGIYILPRMDDQLYVRTKYSISDAVWQDKLKGAKSIKSVTPGKSYMLVSPDLQVSAPFEVDNKSGSGDKMDLRCSSPYEVRYRASSRASSGGRGYEPGSIGGRGIEVKIVDREDTSKVTRIGNVTFVPSSWKVLELEEDKGLSYSDEEKRSARRKVVDRITPGCSQTLDATILNKGIFKLNLHKAGSYVTISLPQLRDATTEALDKTAALTTLIEDVGMSLEDAQECWQESMTLTKASRWVQPKLAAFELTPEMTGMIAGGLGGGAIGALTSKDHKLRNALIGAGAGVAMGGYGGHVLHGAQQDVVADHSGLTRPAELASMPKAPEVSLANNDAQPGLALDVNTSLDGPAAPHVDSPIASVNPTDLRPSIPAVTAPNISGAIQAAAVQPNSFTTPAPSHVGPAALASQQEGIHQAQAAQVDADIYQKMQELEQQRQAEGRTLTDPASVPAHANSSTRLLKESKLDPFEAFCMGKQGANGLNTPDSIVGDMSFPDPQTEIGQHPSGFMETQPTTQIQQGTMNSMADSSQDWRDMDQANWDRINPAELSFLQRAADSGSQPVFESGMMGMILKSNRSNSQIDEWLPDFVTGLDSHCRLLLQFYWHNQDFANSYGKDELSEFESLLLDVIKIEGQVILFLKQRAGESDDTKVDALAEN